MLVLDPKDPMSSARVFLDMIGTHEGARTLHHHRGAFYQWDGTHYPEFDEAGSKAALYSFLAAAKIQTTKKGDPVNFKPNRARVGDVLDALRAQAHLPSSLTAPAWLNAYSGLSPSDFLVCRNGLLYHPARRLMDHTPQFFSHNALDFEYQHDVGEPKELHRFMDDLFDDDLEPRDCLQEIFGYFLTADTRQHKIPLIVGPRRSGKGTIARVLTGLLGQDNVCAPTLASLGTNFGLSPLIGKLAAIIADARLGGRADQHAVAERLLSISGEDAITIDRKYLPPWTGRLPVRFLILTNELPRIADASGALASRFIVISLTQSFYGKEDPGLTDKLLGELPAILNWALDGLARLRKRGHFLQPSASMDTIQDLEDLGSPIKAFIRDRCEVKAGAEVSLPQLFEAWGKWCEEQGRDHDGTVQTFARDLRAAEPGLRKTRPRAEGERIRGYEGIRLLSGWELVRSGPRT
jgi:putative DNA primase/helicase